MITVNVKLEDGAEMPVNAHSTDTGYDVVAVSEPNIVGEQYSSGVWKRIDYIEYDLGVSIDLKGINGFGLKTIPYALIFPRSSVSKYNLILANGVGVIDHEYRNTIKVRFRYIFQPEDLFVEDASVYGRVNYDKIYKKGDKCSQLVFLNKENSELHLVDSLNEETSRGKTGFGDSGL